MGVGLVGVVYLAALTPFNDSVVGNTFLVGNFLPTGVLLFLGVLLLVFNAPLRKLRPRWALSSGELAVILGMMLVAGAIPGSGLMRYLYPSLIGLYDRAAADAVRAQTLQEFQFPDWLLPAFSTEGQDVIRRAGDPVVTQFMGRVPGVEDGLGNAVAAVPWSAWAVPVLTWGLLTAFVFGATLFGAVIVRRQWVENERLAFPLAGVWTSLIAEPERGRALNATLGSRSFWIALGAVFALHSWNAMGKYDPQSFPEIPLGFNFAGSLFAEPPFNHTHWGFKQASVYFSMVGIAFFLQTKVGFSLWFVYLLMNLVRMPIRTAGADVTGEMEVDQSLGATTAFALVILWVGRRHWALVARQMARGRREGEPAGRYLPYPVAGWGLTACTLGMIAMLAVAGVTVPSAVVLTLGTLLLFLVIARVVAETGLIFAQVRGTIERLFVYGSGSEWSRVPGYDYFFARRMDTVFNHDLRENLAVYATHALRVADESAYRRETGPTAWRRTWPFVAALALALLVSYGVGSVSTLAVHYNYQARLDKAAQSPLDGHGMDGMPKNALNDARKYASPGGIDSGHNRGLHFGFGAAVTAGLAFLRLRFDAWPIHPIGFLLVYTYPIFKIWFSLMLGWFAKALIVKFGGPPLMRAARPFFLGLIVGEAAAAAVWLSASLLLVSAGYQYEAVNLLPG